ncbi:MAG TPA: hypothetical protein VGX49_17415 [Jatrophihabitans sp.]|nr:hypothetical protein [Jatrophihabitans sp.]
MRRFGSGDRVVLRTAVRRGRRHKYGRVKLRKGTSGRVAQRHTKRGKPPRYDVQVRRRGKSVRVARVPAASLRRPISPLAAVLAILTVLLVIGYLTRHA